MFQVLNEWRKRWEQNLLHHRFADRSSILLLTRVCIYIYTLFKLSPFQFNQKIETGKKKNIVNISEACQGYRATLATRNSRMTQSKSSITSPSGIATISSARFSSSFQLSQSVCLCIYLYGSIQRDSKVWEYAVK